MYVFTKKNSPSVEPDIFVSGERLQVVSESEVPWCFG